MKSYITMVFVLLVTTLNAQYRPLQSIPDRSTKALVSQTVGITEISVSYFSPCAKGRKIFGERVPYNNGQPFPWRAGANENTVISFEHDVTIQGMPIKAGNYGLHIIPDEKEWVFIFSSSSNLYGSSYGFSAYEEDEDVLRVSTKPTSIDFKECLQYEFLNRTENSVDFCLSWENTRACLNIELDLQKIVVESIKSELRGTKGLYWESWQVAAKYLLDNNLDLDLALEWINRSIEGDFDKQPAFDNLLTKSQILQKMGNTEDASHFEKRALLNGSAVDLYYFGNDTFWVNHEIEKAKEIFEMGVERDSFYSRNYLGLGWVNLQKGKYKKAISFFRKFKELNENESDNAYVNRMIDKAEKEEKLF